MTTLAQQPKPMFPNATRAVLLGKVFVMVAAKDLPPDTIVLVDPIFPAKAEPLGDNGWRVPGPPFVATPEYYIGWDLGLGESFTPKEQCHEEPCDPD